MKSKDRKSHHCKLRTISRGKLICSLGDGRGLSGSGLVSAVRALPGLCGSWGLGALYWGPCKSRLVPGSPAACIHHSSSILPVPTPHTLWPLCPNFKALPGHRFFQNLSGPLRDKWELLRPLHTRSSPWEAGNRRHICLVTSRGYF